MPMSVHADLHAVGFFVSMLSLIGNCFVFVRRFGSLGQRGWMIYSIVSGVATLALIALTNVFMSWAGVIVALAGAVAFGWVTATAALGASPHLRLEAAGARPPDASRALPQTASPLLPDGQDDSHHQQGNQPVGVVQDPQGERFLLIGHHTDRDRGNEADPVEKAHHQSATDAARLEILVGEKKCVMQHETHQESADQAKNDAERADPHFRCAGELLLCIPEQHPIPDGAKDVIHEWRNDDRKKIGRNAHDSTSCRGKIYIDYRGT